MRGEASPPSAVRHAVVLPQDPTLQNTQLALEPALPARSPASSQNPSGSHNHHSRRPSCSPTRTCVPRGAGGADLDPHADADVDKNRRGLADVDADRVAVGCAGRGREERSSAGARKLAQNAEWWAQYSAASNLQTACDWMARRLARGTGCSCCTRSSWNALPHRCPAASDYAPMRVVVTDAMSGATAAESHQSLVACLWLVPYPAGRFAASHTQCAVPAFPVALQVVDVFVVDVGG